MDSQLASVAAAQCGAFTRVQALAAGYTDRRIRGLLGTATWIRCAQGVYRIAGAPVTLELSAWIAVLAAGHDAVLSHRIAGRLHHLDGTPPAVYFDVSVPTHRRPRSVPRAIIHRTQLTADDLSTCNGLPVTSLSRTLVDLARCLPVELGSRIIADALRTRPVQVGAIDLRIAALAGYVGVDRARRALAAADPRLESNLEGELLRLLRRAGLDPVPQYTVTIGGRFIARLDFALPDLQLALESDGYGTHARHAGFERDRERSALLQLAGWTLLSFTAAQIRGRPGWVTEVVLRRVGQLQAEMHTRRTDTASP